jgi:hypothetical protein
MHRTGAGLGLILIFLACAHTSFGANRAAVNPNTAVERPLQDVGLDDFCVTCGALRLQSDGRCLVESPKMRAVVDHMTGDSIDLHFTYLGPTRQLMALSSGLSRIQIGLKLFAHDACNLVYVMWRLYPKPGIVVSTKRNAGMHLSRGCGNRGYNNVRALQQAATPAVAVGVPHRLRVARDGDALSVYADEVLAWQGRLEATFPNDLDGLTGIRSDNGRYILKLQLSDAAAGAWRGAKPACTPTRPSQRE